MSVTETIQIVPSIKTMESIKNSTSSKSIYQISFQDKFKQIDSTLTPPKLKRSYGEEWQIMRDLIFNNEFKDSKDSKDYKQFTKINPFIF